MRVVGRQGRDWTAGLWWRGQRRAGVALGRPEDPWGGFCGRLSFLEEQVNEERRQNSVVSEGSNLVKLGGGGLPSVPLSSALVATGMAKRLCDSGPKAVVQGFGLAAAGGGSGSSRPWGEPARGFRAEVPCGDTPPFSSRLGCPLGTGLVASFLWSLCSRHLHTHLRSEHPCSRGGRLGQWSLLWGTLNTHPRLCWSRTFR